MTVTCPSFTSSSGLHPEQFKCGGPAAAEFHVHLFFPDTLSLKCRGASHRDGNGRDIDPDAFFLHSFPDNIVCSCRDPCPAAVVPERKDGESQDPHAVHKCNLVIGKTGEDDNDRFCPFCSIGEETAGVAGRHPAKHHGNAGNDIHKMNAIGRCGTKRDKTVIETEFHTVV